MRIKGDKLVEIVVERNYFMEKNFKFLLNTVDKILFFS